MADTFVVYSDYKRKYASLTNEQLGMLCRMVFDYNDGIIPDDSSDPIVNICFESIKVDLDRNRAKYEEVVRKRKEAGSKGGLAKVANASKAKQSLAKVANAKFAKHNDMLCNDNDNVNVNDNVNDNDNIISLSEKRFNEFWELYPRKEGKGAAKKKWEQINPNAELFNKIITAVKNNVEHNIQWQRSNGQFIPHPTTWLNQGRWDDDINTVQQEDWFTRELRKTGGITFE